MHIIGKSSVPIPDVMPEARVTEVVYLPTWDRLLIRRRESGRTTRMGLLLPENFQGKLLEGEVIAVGPGGQDSTGKMIAPPFTVGQVVLFSDQSALRIDPDAPDQFMIESRAILAVRA